MENSGNFPRSKVERYGAVIGRILLASLFLLGGLNKVLNFSETSVQMTEAGLPVAGLLLPLVILLEIGAGALVAFAGPFYRIAALALAGFTLLTNIVFHDFWTMQGHMRALELSLFFKNVAIAGALIFVASLRRAEV